MTVANAPVEEVKRSDASRSLSIAFVLSIVSCLTLTLIPALVVLVMCRRAGAAARGVGRARRRARARRDGAQGREPRGLPRGHRRAVPVLVPDPERPRRRPAEPLQLAPHHGQLPPRDQGVLAQRPDLRRRRGPRPLLGPRPRAHADDARTRRDAAALVRDRLRGPLPRPARDRDDLPRRLRLSPRPSRASSTTTR